MEIVRPISATMVPQIAPLTVDAPEQKNITTTSTTTTTNLLIFLGMVGGRIWGRVRPDRKYTNMALL